MSIHPLKKAYIQAIERRYGQRLWGDQSPARTESLAQRVLDLGINYATFIGVGISLWDVWARNQGHPYPYWNVVTSDKTFEAVERYMGTLKEIEDDSEVSGFEFNAELEFAMAYIDWLNEDQDYRPRRAIQTSVETQIRVVEYLCRLWGIKCATSEYTELARKKRVKYGS